MKKTICALLVALLLPDSAQAAWLLWKHSVITRKIEGVPRNMGPQTDSDRWELRNALEARAECLAALREEFKKSHEGLMMTYPKVETSQSILGNGITASMSAATETNPGPSEKSKQILFDFSFWCLPAGVDPKSTTMTTERK